MKKIIGALVSISVLMSFQTAPKKNLPASTKPASPAAGLQASVERGKLVYQKQCLTCHQVDGGGVPHLNAPLDGASAVQGKDKNKLIRIVLNGMTERIEIDGEYYSNNMAPHRELTDQQIADVLTFVRNSWTNKASAVSVAEVRAARIKK